MNKWVKRAIAVAVVLLIVALVITSKLKPLDIETIEVKQSDVLATIIEKGKITSRDNVDITSEIQGKVLEIRSDTGERVDKGDTLAVIDISEIEAQIAQLQGELTAIRGMENATALYDKNNQIRQQQASVEQVKIALKYAKDTYARMQELYKEGAVTSVEVEQAKTDVETKQKALDQAEAFLNQTKVEASQNQKQVRGTKQQYQGQKESLLARISYLKKQKDKGLVVASQSGKVLSKKIRQGDFVTPGHPLFTIGDDKNLIIEVFVASKDLVNIKTSDDVDIIFKLAGGDVKVDGTVIKIAPIAEEKVSALGVAEDKVRVEIEMLSKPNSFNLIPGTTVDVILTTQEVRNTISVPKDTFFKIDGKDYVWTVKADKAVLTGVVKGIEGDDLVQVKSGLNTGDKVILNPHNIALKEGIRVK